MFVIESNVPVGKRGSMVRPVTSLAIARLRRGDMLRVVRLRWVAGRAELSLEFKDMAQAQLARQFDISEVFSANTRWEVLSFKGLVGSKLMLVARFAPQSTGPGELTVVKPTVSFETRYGERIELAA